jgi:hypothetical protein
MPIKYKIYKDIALLYTVFYGRVDKNDAFEYSRKVYREREIDFAKNTLVFLKESRLIFTIEEVEEFSKLIINSKKFKLRKKIALLVDSPTDTVAATIYAQTLLNYRKNIEVELFYTLDAALKFLELSDRKSRIDDVISEHASLANENQ